MNQTMHANGRIWDGDVVVYDLSGVGMKITFQWRGLTLTALGDYEPATSGTYWEPPHAGRFEAYELWCEGEKADFLLRGDFSTEIDDEAHSAIVDQELKGYE